MCVWVLRAERVTSGRFGGLYGKGAEELVSEARAREAAGTLGGTARVGDMGDLDELQCNQQYSMETSRGYRTCVRIPLLLTRGQ